jgi:hypothetical protein
MRLIWESAIRAGEFAGIVPASRGAHCRPLHPRLASPCFLEKKQIMEPRLYERPGVGESNVDCGRTAYGRATAAVRSCLPVGRESRDTQWYVAICDYHHLLEDFPRRGRSYLRPPICPATFSDLPSRP